MISRAIFLVLAALALAMGADTNADDCGACAGASDKECLTELDAEVDSLSDKERLAFEQMIFGGAFMQAVHVRQQFPNTAETCVDGTSDKDCLSALDTNMASLSDKDRLVYLVASCNMLQHWSSFAAGTVAAPTEELSPTTPWTMASTSLRSYAGAGGAAMLVVGVVALGAVRQLARPANYHEILADDEV